jgi:hypothetical protein
MNSAVRIRVARRGIAAALILSLIALAGAAVPALAAAPDQAPPLAAGQARVWFLHQMLPGTAFHAPMVYVDSAPIAISAQGTAFYRDVPAGSHVFSVENCLPQPGTSQAINLQPGTQFLLQVQSDENGAWDCVPPQISYLRPVAPQMASYLFAQLTNEGAR